MDENIVKFQEKLRELVSLGKKKKGILEIQEINDFFSDMELDAEQMEKVYEYLEANHIDVLRVSGDGDGIEELDDVDDSDIVLTDEEELYQPKEQLERIFTHILEVRTERNRKLVQEWEDGQAEDTQSDPKLVFEQFFSQIQGRKLQEEEAAVLEEVFAKIREEEG